MKSSLLILAVFWSSTVFAVQTKYCPESFVVDVPEVKVFSKSFVDGQLEEMSFQPENGDDYDADSILFFQESTLIEAFKVQFSLNTVRSSNCYYHQESLWGGLVRASITGTDKEPKLTLIFEDENAAFDRREGAVELLMFADTVVKRPFYDFSGTDLQIKATGTQSSWGDDYPVYVPIGKAKISGESQKNYFLGNERWSVELLTETCSKQLEEEIASVLKSFPSTDVVTVLPKTIGYKYFKVEFRYIDENLIVYPTDAIEFEFEYATVDDQHLVCDRVMANDFVY